MFHGPLSGRVDLSDADVKLQSGSEESGGYRLSSGDYNGDGILDLAVGAPRWGDDYLDPIGRILLLPGPIEESGVLDGVYLWGHVSAYEDESMDDSFVGKSFTFVGDVDGDGQDDLAATDATGEWLYDYNDYDYYYVTHSEVRLITEVPDTRAMLEDTGLLIGSLQRDTGGPAAPGDVSGDGYADLSIVDISRHASEWSIYLFYSPITNSQNLRSADATIKIGWETIVQGVGDLDGDGFDDLLVGAPPDWDGEERLGEVYLFYGPLTGTLHDEDAYLAILSPTDAGTLGTSFSGSQDLDLDGQKDLVLFDEDTAPSSSTFVSGYQELFGTYELDDARTFLGAPPDGCPGYHLTPLDDIDADGFPDLALYDYCTESEGRSTGVTWIVSGR